MTETKRIDALIPEVLRRTAKRHETLFMIQRIWPRCVGKALAAHTRPVSLQRGRLIVYADQSGDSFALTYARPRLLARLHEATQGRVEDIVVRVGEISQGKKDAVPH